MERAIDEVTEPSDLFIGEDYPADDEPNDGENDVALGGCARCLLKEGMGGGHQHGCLLPPVVRSDDDSDACGERSPP